MKTPIYTTRTFYAALAAIVAAAGGYFTGDITVGVALQTVATSVIGIFLRDGISHETTL